MALALLETARLHIARPRLEVVFHHNLEDHFRRFDLRCLLDPRINSVVHLDRELARFLARFFKAPRRSIADRDFRMLAGEPALKDIDASALAADPKLEPWRGGIS